MGAARVSRSLHGAAKMKEHERQTKELIKKYFQTLVEVSGALILQHGLPVNIAVLDEFYAVHRVGENGWRR